MDKRKRQRGFTLIEMVMVIVILGIVGGMVSVFMRAPIDAYFASARRAALTDEADTALRRMARDIRKALPGSVNVVGGNCIDFIPTRTAGRYRTTDAVAGDGSSLLIGAADAAFNMLGDNSALPANQQIAVGDRIVVYNQAGAALVAATVGTVTAGAETAITFTAPQTFPFASPNSRFYVIPSGEPVMSYVCSGGLLRRNAAACGAPIVGAPSIANHLDTTAGTQGCSFQQGAAFSPSDALFQLQLTLTSAGEQVQLYHEVHADSSP